MTDVDLLRANTAAPSGGWRRSVVLSVSRPAPRYVILRLDVDDRIPHLPGQHYVVRLTAEDGYTASRSYSVASAPSDDAVELCVEELADGEVSGFLADGIQVGDELEVRGPIGGWFVWDGASPALAVGGGTGVVPLVSMLRHARETGARDLVCLVAAARHRSDLPYVDEILAGCNAIVLSRERSPSGRAAGRIAASDLQPFVREGQTCYVCGSAGFAETASRLLVDIGLPATDVRVERFGPSS
ncbi:MAG TPA: FAD-binding oxidoreductase [Actinomycetes bacterium]|nr:FAD-binding oxidoreductase [Actinomycetes bacterium]